MRYNKDMRKRCFLIAVIAAIFGAIMMFVAYPRGHEIKYWEDRARARAIFGSPPDSRRPRPDREQLVVAYAAFGLSVLLFVGGFIIGPPKETTSKSPPEES